MDSKQAAAKMAEVRERVKERNLVGGKPLLQGDALRDQIVGEWHKTCGVAFTAPSRSPDTGAIRTPGYTPGNRPVPDDDRKKLKLSEA